MDLQKVQKKLQGTGVSLPVALLPHCLWRTWTSGAGAGHSEDHCHGAFSLSDVGGPRVVGFFTLYAKGIHKNRNSCKFQLQNCIYLFSNYLEEYFTVRTQLSCLCSYLDVLCYQSIYSKSSLQQTHLNISYAILADKVLLNSLEVMCSS